MDLAFMYAGNSVLQSTIDKLRGEKDWGDIARGYLDRLHATLRRAGDHPFEALNPFMWLGGISSTAENEPGKQDRILVGYDNDGTAIYARNPAGKIGEEFQGYATSPLDMVKRKLGTLARPAFQVASNDRGFGRKVYNP